MTNEESTYNKILKERKRIRAIERAFRNNYKENAMNLNGQLKQVLPSYMMPGNVGEINKVTWPFWYRVSFDLGIDPTIGPSTRISQTFQVSQEACLLLMQVSRKPWTYDNAGDLAPLAITIKDRQSSRQFNELPIPIQNIGKKKDGTVLPTPMFFAPNAIVEIELTSWIPADMASTGNGRHEFTFFGYRMRAQEAGKALSTIFG